MGQMFQACAYDIKLKTCCVTYAGKFHEECYSFCPATLSMHLLLRLKPWRIMWGGNHVGVFDNLVYFTREEDIIGLSTYLHYSGIEKGWKNIRIDEYRYKIKMMEEHSAQWKKFCVREQAMNYFNGKEMRSAKYEGYLLNHTKSLAVDLSDYHKCSKYLDDDNNEIVIDPIPALTETGEGTPLALFDGFSTDTTEKLAWTWCGDMLQILDVLPDGYQIIDCCFAPFKERAKYCYTMYGVNKNGYVIKDSSGNLFEAAVWTSFGSERKEEVYNVKLEVKSDTYQYRMEKLDALRDGK